MYRKRNILKISNKGLILRRTPLEFTKGGQTVFDKAIDR